MKNRIEYVYLSIKDAHDRQYKYMKITIFTLIGMISGSFQKGAVDQ
jgi:hypothetical protein